ncbi:SpaH/EbpB family LPXTG-anchored major pilin [Pseudogracilibacillus sp. SE30717A]|uniref:SpaH/EbpB family LPXTG-anchored major pilin n=1 Tax=Pseudogracilibacillus sp. SE30717A TaxID=3098293 RepID=UPI00300E4BEB
MKKKFSVYHFLVAIMMFSLILPGVASAEAQKDDGKLTIHKYEREPGLPDGEAGDGTAGQKQNVPEDAKELEGVTFKITQTHAYDAVNDRWSEIQNGASFEKTTGAEGQAIFDNLAYGRYTVEEIAGPPHVNLNPNVYSVDIPMTNKEGTELNYDVHIYPKNEKILGAVKLKKIDGDTNKPLAGVVFQLYDENGLVQEGLTTGANGTITVDNLVYGDYYFKEVSTLDGYVLGNQKVDFKIESSTKTVNLKVKNYKSPDIEKSVDESAVNRGETVTYTLTNKFPGDIHEYKNYVITDELDGRLSYVDGTWKVEGVDASALSFTQNEQKLTWSINDFAAFEGVEEIKITFDAKIAEDAPANEIINNKAVIDFENKHGNGGDKETPEIPVTPTAGTLIVIKQDGDKKSQKLKGAEFELRTLDGKVVKSGTTNDDGVIDFGELDYGKYQLVETKAPEGYNKLRNPIDVIVDSDHSEQTIKVDNYKFGWELPKTGGIGTILFTFVGLTLMGAAIYLFIRRRKGDVA